MAKEKSKLDPASKRNFMLIGGAIGVGVLLTLGSAILFKKDKGVPASANISGIQRAAGTNVAAGPGGGKEAPEYQAAIEEYNRAGAEVAAKSGQSFVPVLPAPPGAEPQSGPQFGQPAGFREGVVSQSQPGVSAQPPQPPQVPTAPEAGGKFNEQISMLFQRMSPGDVGVEHNYRKPAAAAEPTTQVAANSGAKVDGLPKPDKKQEVAGALEVYPMVLKTPIDTDTQERVIGAIVGGKLRGADIYGGFARRNESVEVIFNMMRFQGKSYTINAVAMDPESYRSVLSGDVDHKYMQRYGFPILAAVVNAAAAAKADPGTTQTVSSGTVINTSPPKTDEQIVAAGLSAGAQTTSQALAGDKVEIAVAVPPGSYGLMFLQDVFAE